MAKKYPASIYSGIHPDDEVSWGMCCSYEAACSCAEEHYDYRRKQNVKSFLKLILTIILIFAGIGFLMHLDCKYAQEAMEDALAACSYCYQPITSEQNYLEFNNGCYHIDCFEKSFQDLKVIPRGASNE